MVFTGSVTGADLPAHDAAGDVFAMPCRTRGGGLDVEGLGIVFLEASACGLPVVAGDSGGAPRPCNPAGPGVVVDGRDHRAVARAAIELLADPAPAGPVRQRGSALGGRSVDLAALGRSARGVARVNRPGQIARTVVRIAVRIAA